MRYSEFRNSSKRPLCVLQVNDAQSDFFKLYTVIQLISEITSQILPNNETLERLPQTFCIK